MPPTNDPELSQAMVQQLLQQANSGWQGAPLSKYLKWFAKAAKVPTNRAQAHPQFWNSDCLCAFVQFYRLTNATDIDMDMGRMMQSLKQAQVANNVDSDDDMPEPATSSDMGLGCYSGQEAECKGMFSGPESGTGDSSDDEDMPGPRNTSLRHKTVDEIVDEPVLDGM